MNASKTIVGPIDRDVLIFTAAKDLILDRHLTQVDCAGTAAHVTMLSKIPMKHRLFSTRERNAIVKELVRIMRLARQGMFEITEEDQDVHLAVERMLTTALGDLGRRVHTARSRNDQVALDLRLFGKEQLMDTMEAASRLALSLLRFAKKNHTIPMVGRTHLQPAMPSSVGLWASSYAEALLDDLITVQAAYEFNDRCPLGSAAGYGVSLNIDRPLTSRLLGFREPIHNVLYASSARGKCEAVILSALSNLMITLSRLSEDLIIFSMPEFDYFSLPASYCTGSSIMPQKSNPDVLELTRARAARVIACASAATGVIKSLPGGYNRDLQETKEPFIEGIHTTVACLKIMERMVEGLTANREALIAGFTPPVFATDKALELVANGMPFREAYHHVKTHLSELEQVNPCAAITGKQHLGATAGLDYRMLTQRVNQHLLTIRTKRNRYHHALSQLLGTTYPIR